VKNRAVGLGFGIPVLCSPPEELPMVKVIATTDLVDLDKQINGLSSNGFKVAAFQVTLAPTPRGHNVDVLNFHYHVVMEQ
jgi:hypothetical protein